MIEREDPTSNLVPKDMDVLLVASREIVNEQELWLAYNKRGEEMCAKKRVWLVLQYGFPFHK